MQYLKINMCFLLTTIFLTSCSLNNSKNITNNSKKAIAILDDIILKFEPKQFSQNISKSFEDKYEQKEEIYKENSDSIKNLTRSEINELKNQSGKDYIKISKKGSPNNESKFNFYGSDTYCDIYPVQKTLHLFMQIIKDEKKICQDIFYIIDFGAGCGSHLKYVIELMFEHYAISYSHLLNSGSIYMIEARNNIMKNSKFLEIFKKKIKYCLEQKIELTQNVMLEI